MNKPSVALLPCPFCGGEAELLHDEDTCAPTCSECDFVLEIGPFGIGWYGSEADAATAWNRRVTPKTNAAAPEDAQECVSKQTFPQCSGPFSASECLGCSKWRAANPRPGAPVGEVQMFPESGERAPYKWVAWLNRWSAMPPIGTKLYTTPPQPQDAARDLEDAERYRWLRDRALNFERESSGHGTPWCVIGMDLGDAEPLYGSSLDAVMDECMTIDAARAAGGGGDDV